MGCCCCCCCCWSSSSFTSFTQHAKRLSSIVSNWKKRAFARDLLSAPRDSTIDFGRRKKRMLTRIQKNEAPPHLWAKDDGVVPRRPSWRPVRRTRLAGRTRARRRPVCTFFLISKNLCGLLVCVLGKKKTLDFYKMAKKPLLLCVCDTKNNTTNTKKMVQKKKKTTTTRP